jgi:hypothetical protein
VLSRVGHRSNLGFYSDALPLVLFPPPPKAANSKYLRGILLLIKAA